MKAEHIRRLRAISETFYGDYLRDLRTIVDMDSGTYLLSGVNQVADFMVSKFETAGWVVERHRHLSSSGQAEIGDLLIARIQGRRPAAQGGQRVLLIGHMDTVFPEGTAKERPFKIEGNRALGPGVSDMKDGLLAGLYAVACLRQANLMDFDSVTYICNPDEEIGSPFSKSFIKERAGRADMCFVLESAREDGAVVSARKGVAQLRIVIHGRAAHAGVEPERGRSAILQAAHSTVGLHKLNGRWPDVTVNVGAIQGGTRANVVAEKCELMVDVRASTVAALGQALDEVGRLANDVVIPDMAIDVESMAEVPPMEKTEATARLLDTAKQIASALGFELNDVASGGASDANTAAPLCATLDGLGPIGGDDHSPTEWLDLTSVVPRITLLAGLIGLV